MLFHLLDYFLCIYWYTHYLTDTRNKNLIKKECLFIRYIIFFSSILLKSISNKLIYDKIK